MRHEPLQSEILMQLFHIGENLSQIRRVDEAAFEAAPVSWNELIGLRNIIAHGYETIDFDRIWTYASEDLDAFQSSINTSLERLDSED